MILEKSPFAIVQFADVAEKSHILGVKNVRKSETIPDGIKLTLYLSEKEPSFHLFLVNEPVSTIKHCQALLALDTSKVSIEISSHHTVEKRPNSTNSMPKNHFSLFSFIFRPLYHMNITHP